LLKLILKENLRIEIQFERKKLTIFGRLKKSFHKLSKKNPG
tara:strand:+ start:784 stop:906 length:123 start_codon:yes stop_codon:yes gene_type:complete